MFDIFNDIFGATVPEDLGKIEKELYVLYKTDAYNYQKKIQYLKAMGYKIMRNIKGIHRVSKGQVQ